jgi:hypothetical protein
MTTREHGSYAGYQQHRKAGEGACDACKAAYAAYVREWRAASPTYKVSNARDQRARGRAHRRLKVAHPDEYDALYVAELRKLDATQNGRAGAH